MTYNQVWRPILRICALHLTHPRCTHTAVNTEHSLGVQCLAQEHISRNTESGESTVRSLPHLQFLRAWDSNSQPFDYESDSLTIRPRLLLLLRIFLALDFMARVARSLWWSSVLSPHISGCRCPVGREAHLRRCAGPSELFYAGLSGWEQCSLHTRWWCSQSGCSTQCNCRTVWGFLSSDRISSVALGRRDAGGPSSLLTVCE